MSIVYKTDINLIRYLNLHVEFLKVDEDKFIIMNVWIIYKLNGVKTNTIYVIQQERLCCLLQV